MSVSRKWINTRHACTTNLNSFIMVIPNMVMKFQNYYIFENVVPVVCSCLSLSELEKKKRKKSVRVFEECLQLKQRGGVNAYVNLCTRITWLPIHFFPFQPTTQGIQSAQTRTNQDAASTYSFPAPVTMFSGHVTKSSMNWPITTWWLTSAITVIIAMVMAAK